MPAKQTADWVPAPAEVSFYLEHGWFVTPQVLPDDLLERAEEGIKNYFHGHRDHSLPEWANQFDWKPSDGNVLRLTNYLSLQIDAVKDLLLHPAVGRTAAMLAQTPAIRLYKDSVIAKPPLAHSSNSNVGWHTDRSYWLMCSSENMLTAWIPFQDTDETNGSIAVIEGSHQWPLEHNMRTFSEQDLPAAEESLARRFGPLRKKVLKVKRGQISFHDCRLLHGSMENRSLNERTTLAVHLQPEENRYHTRLDESGKPLSHLNDYICRRTPDGLPDYCDPKVFPTLWSQIATAPSGG